MSLASEKCAPCETGVGKLDEKEIYPLLKTVPEWDHVGSKILRRWSFKDFAKALAFVNKIGAVAEKEEHHPDISFGWGYVEVALTTHSMEGLSRNDFIVAAKLDALPNA